MLYAQVIVKQRTQVQELTYGLNAQILPYLKVGSLVVVPLRRRSVKGVVVGFSRSVEEKIKSGVREILKLDKNSLVFSTAQIEVIHQLATYYAAPLAEVAFHALDLPQIWPQTDKISSIKPLIVTGSWSQRRDAYQRIIDKSTSRVLLIFSQNAYAEDFYKSVPKSNQPCSRIKPKVLFSKIRRDHSRIKPPTLVGGSPEVSSKIYPKKVSTIPLAGYAGKMSLSLALPVETTGFQPVVDHMFNYVKGKSPEKLVSAVSKPLIKAIIGTLGQVFFPLQAGDTIIIDQPYHIGAKSQSRPYMTSRRIALVRAQFENLRLVLADSIVSPEDLLAVKNKQFRLIASKSTHQPLSIIDRRGQQELIAPSLMEEIETSIKSGKKILVLVMARGWASALVCQDCGQTFPCSNCRRTSGMVGQKLRCAYCASETDLPKICPSCQSEKLKPIGEGVSAVRNYLASRFPSDNIQELSSDQPIFDRLAQIIVATEKIFSFPSASFAKIYIINVDRLLSGTHLDGPWRLLGYLIELQNQSKQIVVQTYFPDSAVWSAVSTGNVRPFFTEELKSRQRLKLPPYGAVITVRGSASTTEKLLAQAEKITAGILNILLKADITYPEVDDRSRGNYHGHFTVFLTRSPQSSLKTKLASLLPPSWHLDLD